MQDMELVAMLAQRSDGSIVSTGDHVTEAISGRDGVLQAVTSTGMITVSMGPGRVAVAHPGTFNITVSGLSPCGCAATLKYPSVLSIFRADGRCLDHQEYNTVPVTVPQLDDLL